MPGEQIEVTRAVITWARERAGYEIEDLNTKFSKIEEWESGPSFPTYPQLEQLADKLKLPIAVFFFPEPPDLPPISETFRTLPQTEFARLPPRVLYLLRKAKALQLNLAELNDGRNPSDRLVVRGLTFQLNVSTSAMATAVREYVGVSIDDQTGWAAADTALDNWRNILTDVGIFVFKDSFRVEGYSGFCLYDDNFPVIYVNNSTPKTRQIFTLFHELAHLLFHTSGIDTLNAYYDEERIGALPANARRIEIICNRFAAAFLLPDDAFEIAMTKRVASEETATELAHRFHVSREFIFRKFLDRHLIDSTTYRQAVERWASQQGQGTKGGGNYYYNQISYLGSRYVDLALRQYHQHRINDLQLAEYLNIKPKNLGAFEERFAARRP